MEPGERRRLRVVVVGPCASGKSTLVGRLKERGHDAHAVAQEHSAVRDLWNRKQPDVLIALDVSLEEVRKRRSPTWLQAVYERQHQRLASAYQQADLVVDTAAHDADAVQDIVEAFLAELDLAD